jgi:DNA-binding beta-propeller fold protein YncE
MKMTKINGFCLAVVLLLLSGCAGAPTMPRLFWPPPPEEPRLEFIGAYAAVEDFPKTSGQIFTEKLTGQKIVPAFKTPFGIASDGKGTVYVSDIHDRNLRVIDLNAHTIEYFTKDPIFANPFGLTVDGRGNLYIADGAKGKVFVFGPGKQPLFTFGAPDTISKPAYLAINEKLGRIYVSDGDGHRVVVFDLQGKHLFSFGKQGSEDGELFSPQGLAIDREGKVYVADMFNARIQIFDAEGKFLFKFGQRGDKLWEFDRPKALAFDSEGHLYILDSRKAAILIYEADGKLLLATGGGSTSHKMGFGLPSSIFIDANDRIYVADSFNKRFSVWQFLSKSYLAKHPVTDKDREDLLKFMEESKRQSPAGKK